MNTRKCELLYPEADGEEWAKNMKRQKDSIVFWELVQYTESCLNTALIPKQYIAVYIIQKLLTIQFHM